MSFKDRTRKKKRNQFYKSIRSLHLVRRWQQNPGLRKQFITTLRCYGRSKYFLYIFDKEREEYMLETQHAQQTATRTAQSQEIETA